LFNFKEKYALIFLSVLSVFSVFSVVKISTGIAVKALDSKAAMMGYWFNFVQDSAGCGFSRSILFVAHGYSHALLIRTAPLRSGFASLARILHEIKPIAL
jgi:hypothetical protein